MENEEKKNSKKEMFMIIVVVVLAFGLTVAGVVYLAGFLIGGSGKSKTVTVEEPPPIQRPPEDNVLRFGMDDDAEEQDDIFVEPEPVAPVQAAPPPAQVAAPPPARPAPAPAQPAAPAPRPAPAPGVTIPTRPATQGIFQVQLASGRNQNMVNAEAARYLPHYPDVWIMRADLGDRGVWYRIMCCSTDSRDDANATREAIGQRFRDINPIVVSY